jgi:serine/threonine protein kinase
LCTRGLAKGNNRIYIAMSAFSQKYTVNYSHVMGKGASAQVYEGLRKEDNTAAAIKIIYKRNLKTNDVKNIENEVMALRALDNPFHKNVIRLFDMYEDRVAFYFCEELVTGGELFDRIESKTSYEEGEARRLCIEIMFAIKHCHDRNIVHRDLKPENFMMVSKEDDSAVKLVDFGFAATATENNLHGVLGTPMYMAPEIYQDGAYGKPVDMWAMGVIFYIILAGYPPFYDDNSAMLGKRIMKGVFAFHDEYWGYVSAEAKDFISQLLKVIPAERMTIDQCFNHPWVSCH